MTNKHISASGSDITPKQADMETAKSMLKKFDEYIDRTERNFKNAMAFQEQPITVVKSEDINNWIRDRSAEFEEYRANLSDVHGDIDALRKMTCNTAKDVTDTLKLNVELLTFFKQKLEAPAPEPKGFEKIEARFKVWWNTRKVFWWRVGISTFIVLGSALASVLVCLYTTRWSDDAWARRAYDAIVLLGDGDPAEFYRAARQSINEFGRKEAQKRILKLESDIKADVAQRDKEAQQ